MKTIAYTDGATWKTNPSTAAGIGVVMYPERAPIVEEGDIFTLCEPCPDYITTNNQAEYYGIIRALEEWMLQHLFEDSDDHVELELRTDSELIANHINGKAQVRNDALKPLYAQARALIEMAERADGKVTIIHIPREENRWADRLSKEAAGLAAAMYEIEHG